MRRAAAPAWASADDRKPARGKGDEMRRPSTALRYRIRRAAPRRARWWRKQAQTATVKRPSWRGRRAKDATEGTWRRGRGPHPGVGTAANGVVGRRPTRPFWRTGAGLGSRPLLRAVRFHAMPPPVARRPHGAGPEAQHGGRCVRHVHAGHGRAITRVRRRGGQEDGIGGMEEGTPVRPARGDVSRADDTYTEL